MQLAGRLLPRLSIAAALALGISSARAAEPSVEDPCSPDDDECVQGLAVVTPEAGPDAGAAAPLAADAGRRDAGLGAPEASIGTARLRVRPAHIRPGDLFEISVQGEHLRSAAGSFGSMPITLFATGPSSFRGFGAVPIDYPAGPALVHVAVVDEEMVAKSTSLPLLLDERVVLKKTITVDSRFTSPSAAQVAQMKADTRAIAESYRVPFGPPLFSGNFVDPIGHRRGSRFGERRVFNGKTKSRHWGLDIDGDQGEPVKAANDGVVTLARPCFMSGWTVLVSHGAGIFTGYFHFSKFAVKAGQAVKKGEVLGYVGSTGRATGPHLHFAAKLFGLLIDPEALLDFDFAAAAAPGAPSVQDGAVAPDSGSAGPDAAVAADAGLAGDAASPR